MIRPLEWQGLLVPILPLTLKETLHAPVPYVIGISEINDKERSLLNDSGVVIVDLDADSLLLPNNFVLLPEFKKLFFFLSFSFFFLSFFLHYYYYYYY